MITKFIQIFIENPSLILLLILIIIGTNFIQGWMKRKISFRFKNSINCILMYIESITLLLSLFPFQHYLKLSHRLIIYMTIIVAYIFIPTTIVFILGFIYYLIKEIKTPPDNNIIYYKYGRMCDISKYDELINHTSRRY